MNPLDGQPTFGQLPIPGLTGGQGQVVIQPQPLDPRNPTRTEESRFFDTILNIGIGTVLENVRHGKPLPPAIGALLPETFKQAVVFELIKRTSPFVETAIDRAISSTGFKDRTKYDLALIDTSGLKPLANFAVNTLFALPALVAHGDTTTPMLENILVNDNPLFDIRIDPIGAVFRASPDAPYQAPALMQPFTSSMFPTGSDFITPVSGDTLTYISSGVIETTPLIAWGMQAILDYQAALLRGEGTAIFPAWMIDP